jgi:putative glutathione S-transferase
MGLLVEGKWHDRWYDTEQNGGRFLRQESSFRRTVSPDPDAEFPAVAGRYHLYVAWACPWAHRTLLVRALKGLTEAIPVSFVHPDMLSEGWEFTESHPEPLYDAKRLHQLYTRADPSFSGRVTVPVLWDTQNETIVSNESSEIIRMFNHAFAGIGAPLLGDDLYPEHLRAEIDALNATIYHNVNNGVYRAGFATTQAAYEEAVEGLFVTLDLLESRLSERVWLVGDQPTEADWRLLPTLLRFDAVYHSHFKCSRKRIQDYPALWSYTKRLYQHPGVAETFNMEETRRHYFYSHEGINPHRVVPIMPDIDFRSP